MAPADLPFFLHDEDRSEDLTTRGRAGLVAMGLATRYATERLAACKATMRDRAVFDAVQYFTTTRNRWADRLAISQIAKVAGITPVDRDPTDNERKAVRERLKRLKEIGVLEYIPGRGRGNLGYLQLVYPGSAWQWPGVDTTDGVVRSDAEKGSEPDPFSISGRTEEGGLIRDRKGVHEGQKRGRASTPTRGGTREGTREAPIRVEPENPISRAQHLLNDPQRINGGETLGDELRKGLAELDPQLLDEAIAAIVEDGGVSTHYPDGPYPSEVLAAINVKIAEIRRARSAERMACACEGRQHLYMPTRSQVLPCPACAPDRHQGALDVLGLSPDDVDVDGGELVLRAHAS